MGAGGDGRHGGRVRARARQGALLLPSGEALACLRARTFRERLKGLLGTSAEGMSGRALLIERCPSVHTFGMAYPIDVAFVGWDGRVLASARGVAPGRVLSCRGAAAAIERPASPGPWLREGDAALIDGAPA